MPNSSRVDSADARILLALAEHPRATVVALAEQAGLSRNTVQARLGALDRAGVVRSFERCVDPAVLGRPLTAFVTTHVAGPRIPEVAAALAGVAEVVQVYELDGEGELLVQVAAADGDDLYRVAGRILGIGGVERTSTALVMRQLVDYRVGPLLRRVVEAST